MTARKKPGGKTVRYGGRKYEVIRENGKYFFCAGAQFRKLNPLIDVMERKAEKKEEE